MDCEKCDSHIATIHNDDALREKTAKLWTEMNNAPITAEITHCMGCRMDGTKTSFCDIICEHRQCSLKKGVETCGDCCEMGTRKIVGEILNNSKEAKGNYQTNHFLLESQA